MRKDDKLQLLAGIAAVSAVIAMVLILSNLPVIMPILLDITSQFPASAASAEDVIGQLAQVQIHAPNETDAVALVAILAFMALSISSAVAGSKVHVQYKI